MSNVALCACHVGGSQSDLTTVKASVAEARGDVVACRSWVDEAARALEDRLRADVRKADASTKAVQSRIENTVLSLSQRVFKVEGAAVVLKDRFEAAGGIIGSPSHGDGADSEARAHGGDGDGAGVLSPALGSALSSTLQRLSAVEGTLQHLNAQLREELSSTVDAVHLATSTAQDAMQRLIESRLAEFAARDSSGERVDAVAAQVAALQARVTAETDLLETELNAVKTEAARQAEVALVCRCERVCLPCVVRRPCAGGDCLCLARVCSCCRA